jgi:predicted ATPase
MTKTEALEFIINSNKEFKERLDAKIQTLRAAIEKGNLKDVKLDVQTFECLLTDVIRYKWSKQRPETFLNCYVTGDEYYGISNAPYSYFMKTVNGNFREFMSLNELDDRHLYSNGEYTDENKLKMFKKRLEFVEHYLMDEELDIIAWCFNNICI